MFFVGFLEPFIVLVQVMIIILYVSRDIEIVKKLFFGFDISFDFFVFLHLVPLSHMEPAPVPVDAVIGVIIYTGNSRAIIRYQLPLVFNVEKQELTRLLESPLKKIVVSDVVRETDFNLVSFSIFLFHSIGLFHNIYNLASV